jgi:4'-phosphopantetheinyl transferase
MAGFKPDFMKGEHGKPAVSPTPAPFFFNLSHCKQAVACITSDEGEVGIDVECLERYKPSLAEYCMNDDELRKIAASDDVDATFTLLWTRKEALLKLTGEGITDDLKNCLVSERMKGVTLESGIDKKHGYAWSIAHYSS